MNLKVKRGLGLLVVAVIAMLLGFSLDQNGAPLAVTGLVLLVWLGCGAAGLALIAWGLLRGQSEA